MKILGGMLPDYWGGYIPLWICTHGYEEVRNYRKTLFIQSIVENGWLWGCIPHIPPLDPPLSTTKKHFKVRSDHIWKNSPSFTFLIVRQLMENCYLASRKKIIILSVFCANASRFLRSIVWILCLEIDRYNTSSYKT